MDQKNIAQLPEPSSPEENVYTPRLDPEPTIIRALIRILIVLASRKGFIAATTLTLTVATALRVPFLSNSFTADAVILPPKQTQSSLSALTSSAAGLMASSGIASQLGFKDPADVYIGILKSRAVSDEIIAEFHLANLYRVKRISDARDALARHTSFSKGKGPFITISVEGNDPRRVAAMANAFVDRLYQRTSQLAITDVSQSRLFFEQQLHREKDALTEAEVALKNTQQLTGLVAPSGQTEASIRSAAQLRAEIASRQVALRVARSYTTDQNPYTQALQLEISTMQGQLARIENDGFQNDRFEIGAGRLPEAALEYARKLRNLRYHETVYELIAKQYEAAVIDEARQPPLIQVIDRAETPDKRSGPKRSLMVLYAFLLGVVLSCCYVIAIHHIKEFHSDPKNAQTFTSLRSALRVGR